MLLAFEFGPWLPWLIAMGVLVCCSGFFSCSEAALFYLRRQDRRALQSGNPAQRIAAALLDAPDRLLTAVLFWNLVTNILYFTIVSIISIQLGADGLRTEAWAFTLSSLLVLIFFSEMLPKSLAVLQSRLIAALVGIPLAATVRALDPIVPSLRFVNLISRRLFFPKFKPEPYLELADLQRAIELSTSDASLLEQEQKVLQNIVSLSDIRVDEMMRPRTQFLSFRPPVSIHDLKGSMTPSGYLLVTEPDSDEVAAAIPLKYLTQLPEEHLESHAESVVYIPWIATVGALLEEMRRSNRQVAAVVNEFGETIGIVTFDDILDTIFGHSSSRSARLLKKSSIAQIDDDLWHVTGMTSLRRLAKHFEIDLPESKSVTVAGVMQEVLQRLPNQDDTCRWGPFELTVLESADRGDMTIQLTRPTDAGPDPERGRTS